MRLIAIATLSLLTTWLPAAAELPATSSIDAVTVFPEGAEVTRIAKVMLAAGDQTVVLKDLPGSLVSDSVRIQGEAAGKVEIGSVDTRVYFVSEDSDMTASQDARKKLEETLQGLYDKQAALQATLEVANTQKQLITGLVNLPGRPPATGTGTSSEPDWGMLVTLVGERLTLANKVIADTQIAQRDNAKKIAEAQNQLNQQPQAQDQRTEVKIHVSTITPLDATLRIRYQIAGAAWYPIYDARLETGEGSDGPKLSLVRRAIVSQQTGEAWDDVRLALSTTRPQAGTSAPELVPLSVDFMPPPAKIAETEEGRIDDAKKRDENSALEKDSAVGVGGTLAQSAPASAMDAAKAKPADGIAVQQRQATSIVTAFQALYVITDRQSIKSGVGDKRVQIDIKALEPTLAIRAVPKFAETAYLYAKYKLDTDTLLLPGPVSLFRDGVFVGRGDIAQLIGGEDNELGFGADDKVRIKFANLGRKAGETGLISTSKTDTQAFKITVSNLHSRPMPVRILDQLPVSLNDQIKVEMLANTVPPTLRDVDDKKGLVAWDLKLEANQSQELAFGYLVSWPNGRGIVYDQHPGPWALQQK